MGAEMNFKIGDRVKVSTIEDVGVVVWDNGNDVKVKWTNYKGGWTKDGQSEFWYPARQVRLAEEEGTCPWCCRDGCDGSCHKSFVPVSEEPARLSRKEIRKELDSLITTEINIGSIQHQIYSATGWITTTRPKRKEIRARLRQLSAEAFCVDKVLAERIDKIADGV
jgi:hypothetical protein